MNRAAGGKDRCRQRSVTRFHVGRTEIVGDRLGRCGFLTRDETVSTIMLLKVTDWLDRYVRLGFRFGSGGVASSNLEG